MQLILSLCVYVRDAVSESVVRAFAWVRILGALSHFVS